MHIKYTIINPIIPITLSTNNITIRDEPLTVRTRKLGPEPGRPSLRWRRDGSTGAGAWRRVPRPGNLLHYGEHQGNLVRRRGAGAGAN